MTGSAGAARTEPEPAGPPALYAATVRHARTAPVRNSFAHRTYYWLIDTDEPPRLPRAVRPLARFRAEDHGGAPGEPLRAPVDRFLAGHGVDLGGGRITMLAHARVLGYVFNPLTVYWCRFAGGAPACVVAEVCNTYGDRHRYLLRPDGRGRCTTAKELYVSPFNGVDGDYRMALPEPGRRLALQVALHRTGEPPFTAGVRGARLPATPRMLLRLAAARPAAPLLGAARIREQGIRLYLRGLPLVPRPRGGRRSPAAPPQPCPRREGDR